VIGKDEEYPVL